MERVNNPPRNPIPTVDIIIELKEGGVVLIDRKNPPHGWAIPGGFVDYGESLEDAARREAFEETSLNVKLKTQFHTYSDPRRDPRFHTVTTVFVAEADGRSAASDDAKGIGVFAEGSLPSPLVFDHERILKDYFRWKREGFNIFNLL
jgi:ADP-ribose pyrophosphatase YjhB (NUDIX family)